MARWVATAAVAAGVLVPAAQGLSGNLVQVNASAEGNQEGGPVAAGGGAYVAAFTSDAGGVGSTVLLRRFAADGTPLTGDVQVDTTGNQQNQDVGVAAAPDGRFVVVWSAFDIGTSAQRIVARFYAANGLPASGEVTVASAGAPSSPSVSMAADGNAVVAWEAANDILARRYVPTGAPVTGALTVAGTPLNETVPSVAAQPDDGFVVTWDVYHPFPADNEDVLIGRFAADGSVRTPGALAGGDLDDREGPGVVVAAGDGSIVAGWTVGNSGSVAVWRRYAADLMPLTAPIDVGSEPGVDQALTNLSILPSGGVAVAWDRYVTTSQDPEMRRFAADGTPASDVIVGTSVTNGYQGGAELATQPSGEQAWVWTADTPSAGDGDGEGVVARFLSGAEG
ncbi:MAG: large repetitive protein, partial [Solirubrobacteraceae bacterium]